MVTYIPDSTGWYGSCMHVLILIQIEKRKGKKKMLATPKYHLYTALQLIYSRGKKEN